MFERDEAIFIITPFNLVTSEMKSYALRFFVKSGYVKIVLIDWKKMYRESTYISRKRYESISPNAIWYFTEFETMDIEALRIKKIKLRNYGFKGTFGVYSG